MGNAARKPEGESVGKVEETVGDKSVGKAENESVGKLEENTETGNMLEELEGDVGEVTGNAVGEGEEGKVREDCHEYVGKGEVGDTGKASEKSRGQHVRKEGGEIQDQNVGKSFNGKKDSKEIVIAVAGKSESDMSYVQNLTGAAGKLKLPEGATLVAYEQAVVPEDGFRVDVFMDQLMTHQFGRLILYAQTVDWSLWGR